MVEGALARSRRSTVTSAGESIANESISLPSEHSPAEPQRQPVHDNKSHEEIFDQHNDQIQQIFDNRHHDINFDDDGTASWDDESFGNSSLESFDDASLSELRSALIARRQRILDEGSVSKRHRRRGHSLDRSLGSLSFASLTGSLTSLTRRKKKKKKDKDKKKKSKKKKHKDKSDDEKEKDKSKKKKKKDNLDGKKSKYKDIDEGSLKQLKKEKRQKNEDSGSHLDTSTSGRNWDPDKSNKNRSLFNLNLKSPLSSDHNMSMLSHGGGNDSHTFVFYACDENTGCCAFHPEVQLRKKARLGGWVDVLKQCPKCNDPKDGSGPLMNNRIDDNSSLRRGDDNASWRRGDDNASWRRGDDNASWRRRDDDNSSLRRRGDNNDARIRNARSEQNPKPKRRGEDYARQLDRSKSSRQPELSSRHLDRDRQLDRSKSSRQPELVSNRHLDRDRARGEKNNLSSEYDTRGHRPRTERDYLRPRESNHDSREASRRDLHRAAPSKRDLHPSNRSRPGHRRAASDYVSSRHIGSTQPSRSHMNRDPSKRVAKEPSSRTVHESSSRHLPREKRKESISSSDSSSSSSESIYERPKSKRPAVKDKKSVPDLKEQKAAPKGKDGTKSTNKSRNNPAPSHRRQHSDRDNPSRKIERENSHKSASKTSRGRTLSPPKVKPSHQIPTMGAIHQQLRRDSSRSKLSGGGSEDVFIDPTYKYAKDLCQNTRSRSPSRDTALDSSKRDTRRERTRSPPRRQSTGGSGKSKPVEFKPVDFNPPPTSTPHDDSYSSFNESIDFAVRRSSRESLEDMFLKVYSTEPAEKMAKDVFEVDSLADSNFSDTLGDGSDEKANKEEGLSTFFKDTIQSKNPKLYHTINKILEEEQSDNNNSSSKRLDRLAKSVGHAYQPSSRKQSLSNSAFVDPNQHNISLSSLNASEPSLLETSTDNSPIIPEMNARVPEHRKTHSFHPEILLHSHQPVPTHEEKSKSVYPASAKAKIDTSERSYFSEERSATSSFSRKGDLKKMSKEEMMAFASFESMARKTRRSESFGKSSFNAKSSGITPVENEHRHADISTSLIDQMVKRLGSIGSGDGSEGGSKGMELKDLMHYYAEKDDGSGSNNSNTIVTNLQWMKVGLYSGQVNDKIEPHGQGKLVLHNGKTLFGNWQNGKPMTSSGPVSLNDDETEKKKSHARQEDHEKADSEDIPSYNLGDEGRRRDMIKDEDKNAAVARISKLQKGDAAFIRRTDGTWTFSRVRKITKGSAYFVVNPSGSSKSYKAKYWHSHIRACKIPNEKLPPYYSPKRRSSTSIDEIEISDSDVSELANMLRHPLLEEIAPEKSTTPPRTFEIKEVRPYEPNKNRFSIKDLMMMKPPPPRETPTAKKRENQSNDDASNDSRNMGRQSKKRGSTADTSESSRDTTQDDCSTNKGLLRKGRFSFNQEGPSPYVSLRRNVSFSEEWETRSYVKDVPDDISTKTEDEDDNFDVDGTLSSNRAGEYNLKGIEP